jgi:hypothetical protein
MSTFRGIARNYWRLRQPRGRARLPRWLLGCWPRAFEQFVGDPYSRAWPSGNPGGPVGLGEHLGTGTLPIGGLPPALSHPLPFQPQPRHVNEHMSVGRTFSTPSRRPADAGRDETPALRAAPSALSSAGASHPRTAATRRAQSSRSRPATENRHRATRSLPPLRASRARFRLILSQGRAMSPPVPPWRTRTRSSSAGSERRLGYRERTDHRAVVGQAGTRAVALRRRRGHSG